MIRHWEDARKIRTCGGSRCRSLFLTFCQNKGLDPHDPQLPTRRWKHEAVKQREWDCCVWRTKHWHVMRTTESHCRACGEFYEGDWHLLRGGALCEACEKDLSRKRDGTMRAHGIAWWDYKDQHLRGLIDLCALAKLTHDAAQAARKRLELRKMRSSLERSDEHVGE